MDLGILNTVIALVIVLLVLSLLVQAIQTLIKKLLKMKSRQIEGSLKDLYEQVVGVQNPEPPTPVSSRVTLILTTIKRVLGTGRDRERNRDRKHCRQDGRSRSTTEAVWPICGSRETNRRPESEVCRRHFTTAQQNRAGRGLVRHGHAEL